MQPQEPPTGQVPLPPTARAPAPVSGGLVGPGIAAPGGGRVGRRGNRRMRLWLALVGGVMALLCLGGVGVAVSLYDNATKIKRSAPDAVVDNFLRAYLVNRDDEEAALYQCKSGGDFTQIAALRSDVAGREKKYSMAIRFTWTSLTIETEGGRITVSTEVFRAISDGSERTSDHWQFQMVDQDGWRVCGALIVS